MYKLRYRKADKPQARLGLYVAQETLDRAHRVLRPLNISISSVAETALIQALNRIEKKSQKNT